LVQVNSSNEDYAIQSFVRLIKDRVMWSVNLGTVIGLSLILYTPFSSILKLAPLSIQQISISVLIAVISVFWYELVKLYQHHFKR
jgi:Ca2+-transporting ATPase